MRAAAAALAVLMFAAAPAVAAPPSPQGAVAATPPRLRLYLESPDATLDTEFLRRELAWVDWVRDRADADVIVLLTARDTGSGGGEGTFYVSRPHGGGPASDTVRVYAPPTSSDDDDRRLVARTLAAVLARDLAMRPEGAGLRVTVDPPQRPAAPPRDPWNHWVYSLSANGYASGEQSYDQFSLRGTLTASRVTETTRMGTRLTQSHNESHYEFGDGSEYRSVFRSWNSHSLVARSLGPRWSVGTSVNAWSSTYSNTDLSLGVGPAVEVSAYPYAESSRRSLTLAWQLYAGRNDYEQETLYGKTAEWFVLQEVDAGLSRREPWGTIDLTSWLHQYLHDLSLYSVGVNGSVGLKLFRGFSLDLSGNASRVHDQISLPRGDATDSEVLVRQRQLATSYQYWVSVGLSYRFGSLFNNAVNQRLVNTLGAL